MGAEMHLGLTVKLAVEAWSLLSVLPPPFPQKRLCLGKQQPLLLLHGFQPHDTSGCCVITLTLDVGVRMLLIVYTLNRSLKKHIA